MDNISFGLSILFSLGAATCLGLAIYFFIKNRIKQGTAFSGLMFVCVVLAYVPQLDSIKGGFVDAKFNRTLNQANDIIARLSQMAIINAKVSYTTLAWGNRMAAGPYAKDKQAILDEIDRQLVDLKASASDRREISRTFVNLIGVDLHYYFSSTMEQVVSEKQRRLGQVTVEKEKNPESQAAYEKAIEQAASWRRELDKASLLVETFNLPDVLIIPTNLLDEREQQIAKTFRDRLIETFNECVKKGGYTNEAAALIDNLNSNAATVIAKQAREMFGPTFEKDH
jgi:Fe-S oxidoreductase